MRLKPIALFAAAAASAVVSLSSVAAPQGAGKEVVAVNAPRAGQVALPVFMFDRVQGEYALEDGRVLTISGKGRGAQRTLYADLGDGPTEIVHVGSKRFVAVGKDLGLRFQGDKIPDTVYVRDGGRQQVASAQR